MSLRLTGKDVIATSLVAAIVVIFLLYLAVGRIAFVDTVPEMAVLGLVGGFLSRLIGGREDFRPRWPPVAGAFVTLGLGILAMIIGSSAVLATFIAANVLLAAAAIYVRTSPTGARR
jgi:hypothetical protein